MDPQSKYARYSNEQLEILELVYNECPKPSASRRQQLVKESPILANIAPKQLKVWFQNRRCREKQRKETSRLHGLNSKLTALNKILVENNDHLAKQSIQLILQKHSLRKHLYGDCSQKPPPSALAGQPSALAGTSEASGSQNLQQLSLDHRLLALAEESLADFLAKATGTAVDWIQLLGMKPGPDSFGVVAISHGCDGVGARALGLVALEAHRIVEVLKDKSSWLWDCRRSDVMNIYSVENGSTMEIMHTELYAPTTLAPPRDFCTLRFTTSLEDGNFVVCERSITDVQSLSFVPSTQYFVRADMLTSGYLVRPCEGGSCIVHIIDHLDLKPSSVSEVLRPLYRSSSLLAQRVTVKALRFLKHLAQEEAGEIVLGSNQQPSVLRSLSRRMARGFNDAVNGCPDDGWCNIVGVEGDNVTVSCNATINFIPSKFQSERLSSLAGVLCAKASMLLHNVHPSYLIRFLRDNRSEWGCNMDVFQQDCSSRSQGKRQAHVPLFHTSKEDFLEAVILEGHCSADDGTIHSRDIYLLQLCSGIEEEAVDCCAQLIFAPVDANLSDDMPLLSSGFRVLPLCDEMDEQLVKELDLPEDVKRSKRNQRHARSILTIAFQFMYEVGTRESVAEMARNYVRNVMEFIQRITLSLAVASAAGSSVPAVSAEGAALILHILQSYSFHLGTDIFPHSSDRDAAVTFFWHYGAALICCSFKAVPQFVIANQAGMEMLETTVEELQGVSWDATLGHRLNVALCDVTKFLNQECAQLPEGACMSSKGKRVHYERGLVWKVQNEHVAFMFIGRFKV